MARAKLMGQRVVREADRDERLGWHSTTVGVLNGFELRCNTKGEEDDALSNLKANQNSFQRKLKKKMEQKSKELALAKRRSREAREARDKELKQDAELQARLDKRVRDAARELFEIRFPPGTGASGVDVVDKALAVVLTDAGLPPTGRNADAMLQVRVTGERRLSHACREHTASMPLPPLHVLCTGGANPIPCSSPDRWLEAAQRLSDLAARRLASPRRKPPRRMDRCRPGARLHPRGWRQRA